MKCVATSKNKEQSYALEMGKNRERRFLVKRAMNFHQHRSNSSTTRHRQRSLCLSSSLFCLHPLFLLPYSLGHFKGYLSQLETPPLHPSPLHGRAAQSSSCCVNRYKIPADTNLTCSLISSLIQSFEWVLKCQILSGNRPNQPFNVIYEGTVKPIDLWKALYQMVPANHYLTFKGINKCTRENTDKRKANKTRK